ncbi:MAG: 4-(cytidine 5'-diphospho)-2-C-methyl-D-erythritol kinase [Candidatus Poribacteria bacterium]|nr:4-(cytidine 5'-diphospho)-2-C-methyl-D-erythritol kinase [Candidatus Poribacteria bacterium]
MNKPKTLRVRAHAKINLYLNVVGKREDGYHNLETVFHSIDLHDEVILRERTKTEITIKCEHPDVPSDSRNLAYRAAQSLSDVVGGFGGLEIQIHKQIPVAAGLAGGSANAAAVLYGLNELFALELSENVLMKIGAQLGADVPFCLHGGAAFGTGIGDILTPLPALSDVPLVLINPGIAISTPDIFKNLDITLTKQKKESIIIQTCIKKDDVVGVGKNLSNLLEVPVFSKYPELATLKTQLSTQTGCYGALMSGSGATMFALMENISTARRCESLFKNNVSFCTTTVTNPVGVRIQ